MLYLLQANVNRINWYVGGLAINLSVVPVGEWPLLAEFPRLSITLTSQWARWRLKSPASWLFTTVYSDADQRKHQSSASLAFVRGIHRWPVNSPHKWPVTRKMFPFDDVIMHEGTAIMKKRTYVVVIKDDLVSIQYTKACVPETSISNMNT